jgi:hypothetical protein
MPLFEMDQAPALPVQQASDPATRQNDARRSIRYLVNAALRYGKMGTVGDVLDRVAAFRQYKPYNALLVLLQRPAATFVLPAHAWGEKYGRVIRPNEQPLVMLQRGGPVMFLFDVSQTEAGPGARPLPLGLRNPYEMKPIPDAPDALASIIDNAKFDAVRVSDAGLGLPYAGCARRTSSVLAQRVTVGRRPLAHAEVRVRFDVLLNRSYSPTEQPASAGLPTLGKRT